MFKITYSFGETSVCYEAETIEGLVALVEGHYADDENDGWIEWSGGECPVDVGTEVAIKLRNEAVLDAGPAETWRWSALGFESDIIAYKVIKS